MKSSESQNLTLGKPAISFVIDKDKDDKLSRSMRVEMATLESDPVVIIDGAGNGAPEEQISYVAARHINPELFIKVTKKLQSEISTERRKRFNPSVFIKDLAQTIEIEGFKPGEDILRVGVMFGGLSFSKHSMIMLAKDEKAFRDKEKYIPYLVWSLKYDRPNAWKLYLTGFDEDPIASADWNDAEGLSNLAHAMLDTDSLKTMAALQYPAKANIVTALSNTQSIFDKCLTYEHGMTTLTVRALLHSEKSSLILPNNNTRWSEDSTWAEMVRPLVVEGKEIAYCIPVPRNPKFKINPNAGISFRERGKARWVRAKYCFVLSPKDRMEKKEERRIALRNTWIALLTQEVEKKGWSIISLPDELIKLERDPSEHILISKLNSQEWLTLNPILGSIKWCK